MTQYLATNPCMACATTFTTCPTPPHIVPLVLCPTPSPKAALLTLSPAPRLHLPLALHLLLPLSIPLALSLPTIAPAPTSAATRPLPPTSSPEIMGLTALLLSVGIRAGLAA